MANPALSTPPLMMPGAFISSKGQNSTALEQEALRNDDSTKPSEHHSTSQKDHIPLQNNVRVDYHKPIMDDQALQQPFNSENFVQEPQHNSHDNSFQTPKLDRSSLQNNHRVDVHKPFMSEQALQQPFRPNDIVSLDNPSHTVSEQETDRSDNTDIATPLGDDSEATTHSSTFLPKPLQAELILQQPVNDHDPTKDEPRPAMDENREDVIQSILPNSEAESPFGKPVEELQSHANPPISPPTDNKSHSQEDAQFSPTLQSISDTTPAPLPNQEGPPTPQNTPVFTEKSVNSASQPTSTPTSSEKLREDLKIAQNTPLPNSPAVQGTSSISTLAPTPKTNGEGSQNNPPPSSSSPPEPTSATDSSAAPHSQLDSITAPQSIPQPSTEKGVPSEDSLTASNQDQASVPPDAHLPVEHLGLEMDKHALEAARLQGVLPENAPIDPLTMNRSEENQQKFKEAMSKPDLKAKTPKNTADPLTDMHVTEAADKEHEGDAHNGEDEHDGKKKKKHKHGFFHKLKKVMMPEAIEAP